MKRLNNKGITTVEVIICFVIVLIITVSMYSTISYYNEKRIIEEYKQEITSFKNEVTQAIQTDLISIGLIDATVSKNIDTASRKTTYIVDMNLRDSTKKQLRVEQTLTKSSYHPQGYADKDDEFLIMYGTPGAGNANMTVYELPKLGSYKTDYGKIAQDLSINNVHMEVVEDRVLSIYIGLYHPELGTRYAIDIVTPIDFVFTSE